MANDYPDGDFLPGFGASSGDRGYGRDQDRDNRRGDFLQDSRRGGGRDRNADDEPYYRARQDREDRYEGDRYDDGYARDQHAGNRYAGDQYDGDQYDGDQYAGDQYDGDEYGDNEYADDGRGPGRRGGAPRGGDRRVRYDDDEGNQPRRRRGRARRLAPWIALLVLLVLVVPLAGGGLYAYNYLQAKNHPPDYSGAGSGPPVAVQVHSGDTATSLAPRLVAAGVVESDRAFILAAENSTSSAGLEAGFFLMDTHMKASLAYAYLLDPKNRVQKEVTLPEGLRVSDTLIRLSKGSGIPVADFQAVLKNQLSQLALPQYAGNNPEGYLFPATYAVIPHESALAIVQGMVNRFAQEAQAANLPPSETVTAHGGTLTMTTTQLMIVASLVQAEGGHTADFPTIAEVIYNRLKAGMKLQLDSTVFYGLGTYGTSATTAQLAMPNAYSTYLHAGLPPGPIDSPGDAAIQATLHPATGSYLYFFGCTNGKTVFSSTTALTSSSC
jgi:UPF0755 protein